MEEKKDVQQPMEVREVLKRNMVFTGFVDIAMSKKGKPVHIINFFSLNSAREDGRAQTFFVDAIPEDVKQLRFGVVVEVFMTLDEDLNNTFVKIGKVLKASPYFA